MPSFHTHMCPKCCRHAPCQLDCKINPKLGLTAQGHERGANANCAKCGPDDPRPVDPAELARLVAKELRNRSVVAAEEFTNVYVLRPLERDPNVLMTRATWYPWSVHFSCFDKLGPIACADFIWHQERKWTQEWAGDDVAKVE